MGMSVRYAGPSNVDSLVMPDRTVQDFPLFPLGLVALPYEYVPLHVFEPRYRTMFAECLERESEFGVVWATATGLHAVGCACEIAKVIERMEDGRLNVLTRGTRPFRIVERRPDRPYPRATVEFLVDAILGRPGGVPRPPLAPMTEPQMIGARNAPALMPM